MPSVTFAFAGDTPVVTRQLSGQDERYMNPGAIIEHDGQLHMYANVFSQWPGHMVFPHLVSNDGATWSRADSSPAFTSDDIPYLDNGADVSAGYIAADGTWVLVFETVEVSVEALGDGAPSTIFGEGSGGGIRSTSSSGRGSAMGDPSSWPTTK